MGMIEGAAVILGLVSVYLTIRQNVWCWPAGLAQVVLFIYIFHQARLYSDMGLHVVYVVLQIYGWHNWVYGGEGRSELAVSRVSRKEMAGWIVAATVSAAGLGYFTGNWLGADVPYLDAATTVLSLIAQYLMTRKKLESWLFWIAVDALCVGIYPYKGLYLTTALYWMFLYLAANGYWEWRKDYQKKQPA